MRSDRIQLIVAGLVIVVLIETLVSCNHVENMTTIQDDAAKDESRPISEPANGTEINKKYEALVNRLMPGMTREQVEEVLGIADEEKTNDLGKFNPQKAGQILTILTWNGNGDSKPSIILSFINDRLSEGGTPGYDITKGFHER